MKWTTRHQVDTSFFPYHPFISPAPEVWSRNAQSLHSPHIYLYNFRVTQYQWKLFYSYEEGWVHRRWSVEACCNVGDQHQPFNNPVNLHEAHLGCWQILCLVSSQLVCLTENISCDRKEKNPTSRRWGPLHTHWQKHWWQVALSLTHCGAKQPFCCSGFLMHRMWGS